MAHGFSRACKAAFKRSNVYGGLCDAGLLPFNPEKILHHIEVPFPTEQLSIIIPQTPLPSNGNLDANLFNTALLTSSPLDAESSRKTASTLHTKRKFSATSVRRLIPRLTAATERLHAENSILQTPFKVATDVLNARKEQKRHWYSFER